MKTGIALALALMWGGGVVAATDHDTHSLVTWSGIAGVITAPGVDNPVAVITDGNGHVVRQIHSGTLPWVTRAGWASVDLITGAARFAVTGLVLNGGNASGTAGVIDQAIGTLVCNPGSTELNQPQSVINTQPIALSLRGDASFSGELTYAVPFPCTNPLFLIRTGPAFGPFAGRWLATGVDRHVGDSNQSRGDRSHMYDRR